MRLQALALFELLEQGLNVFLSFGLRKANPHESARPRMGVSLIIVGGRRVGLPNVEGLCHLVALQLMGVGDGLVEGDPVVEAHHRLDVIDEVFADGGGVVVLFEEAGDECKLIEVDCEFAIGLVEDVLLDLVAEVLLLFDPLVLVVLAVLQRALDPQAAPYLGLLLLLLPEVGDDDGLDLEGVQLLVQLPVNLHHPMHLFEPVAHHNLAHFLHELPHRLLEGDAVVVARHVPPRLHLLEVLDAGPLPRALLPVPGQHAQLLLVLRQVLHAQVEVLNLQAFLDGDGLLPDENLVLYRLLLQEPLDLLALAQEQLDQLLHLVHHVLLVDRPVLPPLPPRPLHPHLVHLDFLQVGCEQGRPLGLVDWGGAGVDLDGDVDGQLLGDENDELVIDGFGDALRVEEDEDFAGGGGRDAGLLVADAQVGFLGLDDGEADFVEVEVLDGELDDVDAVVLEVVEQHLVGLH